MAVSPPPTRPRASRRRVVVLLSALVGIAILIAITATIAALTVPDNESDSDATAPVVPIISDQQATDIATSLTQSMFDVTPATADAQIAAFKADTCGDLAKDGLPNLVSFTDELKSQDLRAALTLQSVALVPHEPQAPVAQVIVAATWQTGEAVNKLRVVYDVIVQNGKTCVTRAQFL